jgi:hypothetical protein
LITAACQHDPINPRALLRRIETGRQCFAAWVDGCVAAYGWVTHGPEWVGEFERELQVQDGEAYIWDCATLPKYRHQRLFSGLLRYMITHLWQQGLERVWIIGLAAPLSILQGVTAAGFDPVVRLTYLRLLDKRHLLTTSFTGVSDDQLSAARRLLTSEKDRAFGPLIVGNSRRPTLPDTHYMK